MSFENSATLLLLYAASRKDLNYISTRVQSFSPLTAGVGGHVRVLFRIGLRSARVKTAEFPSAASRHLRPDNRRTTLTSVRFAL